jgi:hypothetical protein
MPGVLVDTAGVFAKGVPKELSEPTGLRNPVVGESKSDTLII